MSSCEVNRINEATGEVGDPRKPGDEREARAGVHLRVSRACKKVQPGSDDGKEEVASR